MFDKIFPGQSLKDVLRLLPTEELKHMHRVNKLTNALLRILSEHDRLGKFDHNCLNFKCAAFYHDVGKAWVQSDILTKAEKLTAQEYQTIKMHPLYAQEYFKKNPNALCIETSWSKLIFDAAVFHHERWDGRGYPYGISEKRIPFIARATAVCDVYDAITSQRSYRKARTHEEACTEIERYAGTQFDPDIALFFLDNEEVMRRVQIHDD